MSKFIEDGGNIDQVLELSRLASEDLVTANVPFSYPNAQLTLSPTARVRDLLPYEVHKILRPSNPSNYKPVSEEPHPYLAYDELVSQFYSILMTSFRILMVT